MPLGWNITVYRQQSDGSEPASFGAKQGSELAVWQTGLDGLRWLDELCKKGHAIDLGGDGYPCEYSAKASHVTPHLLGKTTTHSKTIDACRSDEWLIVQAWDQS